MTDSDLAAATLSNLRRRRVRSHQQNVIADVSRHFGSVSVTFRSRSVTFRMVRRLWVGKRHRKNALTPRSGNVTFRCAHIGVRRASRDSSRVSALLTKLAACFPLGLSHLSFEELYKMGLDTVPKFARQAMKIEPQFVFAVCTQVAHFNVSVHFYVDAF